MSEVNRHDSGTTQPNNTGTETETVSITVNLRDALGGVDPGDLDDCTVEGALDLETDLAKERALRKRARDRLDVATVTRAKRLLWIDEAEVYAVCDDCYEDNRDGAWTGSTEHPHYQDLMDDMCEKLEDGAPCAFCKTERVDDLVADLAERIEFDVTVTDGEGEEGGA